MANREKLLKKISNNRSGVRFGDLCKLAELYDFRLDRIDGSHHVFTYPGLERPLILQKMKDGKAKPYQVKQVLEAIETISGNY